jgi:hypothetical protein
MSNVTVEWHISDGYVGGSRPQTARVEVSDFVGLTRVEAERLLNEIMQEHLLEKVTWECKDYDASLQEIMDAAAKLSAD